MNWLLDLFRGYKFGGISRSPKWSEVRKAHLKENPFCAVCGNSGSLLNGIEIHHCRPFHIQPELELDDTNLISLCRIHHFWFGHLGSWASFNEKVWGDSTLWRNKIQNRPR